jgi:hypothetical protein
MKLCRILLTLLAASLPVLAVAGCGGSSKAVQPDYKPLSNYESVEAIVGVLHIGGEAGRYLKREMPKCIDGRYEKDALFDCEQKVMDKGSDGYLNSSRGAIKLAKRVPRCAVALRGYGNFFAGWAQAGRAAVPRSKAELTTYQRITRAAHMNERDGEKAAAPLLRCIDRLSK